MRKQTISKNFFDDEIIGVYANGDIYLNQEVKRKYYIDETEEEVSHINDTLMQLKKEYLKEIKEEENYN